MTRKTYLKGWQERLRRDRSLALVHNYRAKGAPSILDNERFSSILVPRTLALPPGRAACQPGKLGVWFRAMPSQPSKTLETFDNPMPERDYTIRIEVPEFTCLCPKTGQPDFATLYLEYVPEAKCVELKSLKMYVWAYRDEGAFHEKVTNTILDDLVRATEPRFMRLTAKFNVRGGIYTSVVAEHRQDGWQPPQAVTLP